MLRTLFFIGFLSASFAGYSQITSTFNVNAQGWTAPNANGGIVYSATGGNPGGLVSGRPFFFVLGATTIYIPFNFVAPAAYLGNRSTYYGGTLRYDIQQSTTGAPNQYTEVRIRNTSGVNLYYFPSTPNQPVAPPAWSTYSVVLNNANGLWKTTNNPTGPLASEIQIQNVLSALDTLEIRGLYRDANTINRLDNVSFTPPIVVTTQPNSASVCNGITATFTTAATGNPAITHRWQFESSPGVWTDLNNGGGYSNVTTATLSVNTSGNFGAGNYRCRISGTAVVDAFSNIAALTINALPTSPGATGAVRCGTGAVTLTATGGAAGQYRWYTVPSGGSAIAGQTNATYTTPSLTVTTPYYVAINNGICESARTSVTATVNTIPGAPGTSGNSFCGTGSVVVTATGGTAGQYRWYTVPSGGTAIAGQTNATYATPVITLTTTYYVSINNGACESTRTAVVATINTVPNAPTTTGAQSCPAASVTLIASGGAAGQYRWYTLPTGGSAISGQTNGSFTTPLLNSPTSYYVSIFNGTCESARSPVLANVAEPGCDNVPPVITPESSVTQVEGIVTINLASLISDGNDNVDLSTLRVITPPASGAVAVIDASFNLVINYSSLSFSGTESITIEVCDIYTACAQQTFSIQVVGEINVYNAVSPNNDGDNDLFEIGFIEALADTQENKVSIFNRWGALVWEGINYNNSEVVFKGLSNNGSELPSGTYFYKIEFSSGHKSQSGYLVLKR
jgi:gliding motility-associated-like protein